MHSHTFRLLHEVQSATIPRCLIAASRGADNSRRAVRGAPGESKTLRYGHDSRSQKKKRKEGTCFPQLIHICGNNGVRLSLVMTTATNSWERFLEHVKSRVSINTYTTWFLPTRLHRAHAQNLLLP